MDRRYYLLSADTEMNDQEQCKCHLLLRRNLSGLVKRPLSFICFSALFLLLDLSNNVGTESSLLLYSLEF